MNRLFVLIFSACLATTSLSAGDPKPLDSNNGAWMNQLRNFVIAGKGCSLRYALADRDTHQVSVILQQLQTVPNSSISFDPPDPGADRTTIYISFRHNFEQLYSIADSFKTNSTPAVTCTDSQ
jgi:hypothetical protein